MPDAPVNNGQGTPNEQPFDFERGYNEIRPEFTRVTQENSQYRDRLSEYEQLFTALHDDSDPEAQRAAMAWLGLEMDPGSQEPQAPAKEDEWVDPLEEKLEAALQRVEQLEARELEADQRAEARELEALRDSFIGETLSDIEASLKPQYGDNFKFTEREEEALGNLAIALEDEDGIPNVKAAYDMLYGDEGVLETNRARWIATKNAPSAPVGTTIPADQKPTNRRERIDYFDKRVAQIEQQQ